MGARTPAAILIPVRPGNRNEELRFSLRSIQANLPHTAVWIVGHQPNWLTNVGFIPGNTHPHARANVYRNLLTACEHPDTPDDMIVTNDDFFITEPVETPAIHYRSTLQAHIDRPRLQRTKGRWWQSLTTTQACLQALGHTDPLSYELHIPLPIHKQQMAETLHRFKNEQPANPPQWRTLYGVINDIGGTPATDPKAYRDGPIETPYHSTTDASFRYFAQRFKAQFPEPSRYEKKGYE